MIHDLNVENEIKSLKFFFLKKKDSFSSRLIKNNFSGFRFFEIFILEF